MPVATLSPSPCLPSNCLKVWYHFHSPSKYLANFFRSLYIHCCHLGQTITFSYNLSEQAFLKKSVCPFIHHFFLHSALGVNFKKNVNLIGHFYILFKFFNICPKVFMLPCNQHGLAPLDIQSTYISLSLTM